MKMKWKADGSCCPICCGQGRHEERYPAALCRSCQKRVVDAHGNSVGFFNESLSGGLLIKSANRKAVPDPASQPIFCNGIECRARQARFGGVVVQPLEAWQSDD